MESIVLAVDGAGWRPGWGLGSGACLAGGGTAVDRGGAAVRMPGRRPADEFTADRRVSEATWKKFAAVYSEDVLFELQMR